MSECNHKGLKFDCEGTVSRYKGLFLCRAHTYRAFLLARNGVSDEHAVKTPQNEDNGVVQIDMFSSSDD